MNASLLKMLLGSLLLAANVHAQVPDRVGRVAYLAGDVQFYSEATQAWLPAELNAPVSSRNSLATGPDGRAEIRFGSAVVTLDAQTQLDIQVLDDEGFKALLSRGSANLHVPALDSDESYEVMAPPSRYKFLQAGRYRVDVEDAWSSVSVFAGLAKAILPNNEVLVGPGKSLSVNGSAYQLAAARLTALDDLAAQRDDALHASQATRYVSPNMTGYEELDANGRWESDPDYGTVWYPSTYVSADWVPYRDGRWAYVAPWGWTWIDAAPWGFAPFHYGRWVRIGAAWAWTPGTYVKRPSYAPALVTFVGGSPGVSVSLGARSTVSWYPLPPWEAYRPSYKHRSHHLHNINNFGIKEPPLHARRTVDRYGEDVNRVYGKTEVPHSAFVESRHRGRFASPSSRGGAVSEAVPAVPMGSSRSDHGEFGKTSPAHDPATRRRSSSEGNVSSKAAESAQGAVPNPSSPWTGGFRGETFVREPANERGRERQASPVVVTPQIQNSSPVAPRVETPVPRSTIQPSPPEGSAGSFTRHERWQRESVESRQIEAAPQHRSAGEHFGGGRSERASPPAESGPPRMRVESPAARAEPRQDFQNRSSRQNAPEAQRDPEKDRSGAPERGRSQGEWRNREQGGR